MESGNRLRSHWIGSALALALLLGGRAEAATQGETGASSQGAIAIGVRVAPTIHTIGLSDVTLGDVVPASTADNAQNVCVWSNTATRGYSITATGSGPANAFILANGSMAAAYSVSWSSSVLAPGMALAGLTATASATGCASGAATPASLTVRAAPSRARLMAASYSVASSQPSMAAAAGYSGALTLIVSPQ